MAYISREYDEQTIADKIYSIRPDISFGQKTRIEDIDVEPAYANSQYRVVKVELHIPITHEEFAKVFSDPKG